MFLSCHALTHAAAAEAENAAAVPIAAPTAAPTEEAPRWRADVPVIDLDSLTVNALPENRPPHPAAKPQDGAANAAAFPAPAPATGDSGGGTPAVPPAAGAPPDPAAMAIAADRAMLRGVVLRSDDGKPVAEALVVLQRDSLRLSARSDAEGLCRIAGIPPGTWKISVFRKGYETREMPPGEFRAGEVRALEIRLERRILKGQVIRAQEERKAGSAQDLLAKRQKSTGVMEGVSAEQIAKSTDSDAGAVARRVTGTSLVGGKYIYVRGLGERYTNMTLNGLPIPSPEKDKRVVPQDLFPAGSLESFAIYKTFMPDLYSDFAGGSVALVTKDIPDKGFFRISMASGNHYDKDMDTGDYLRAYLIEAPKNGRAAQFRKGGWRAGDTRLTYNGGNTFWGFDDGMRSLPDGFPEVIPKGFSAAQAEEARRQGLPGFSPEERAALAGNLPNIYAVDTGSVRPPMNFSLSAGNVYPGAAGGKFGYLLNAGFKNKYDQYLIERQGIAAVQAFVQDTAFYPSLNQTRVTSVLLYDTVATDTGMRAVPVRILKTGTASHSDQGTYDAQLSGMLNMRYENEDWSVWWKNFGINIGTDKTVLTRSYLLSTGGGVAQDKAYEERYLLEFSRRHLLTSQVGGDAYVGKGLLDSLSWAAGISTIASETPDSRRYLYSQNSLQPNQSLQYSNNDVWGTRIFDKLSENAVAARLDAFLIIPPEYSPRDTFLTENRWFSHLALPAITAGAAFNTKGRNFTATRYSYDGDRSLNEGKTLEEIRDPAFLQLDILSGFSDFATSPKDYDTYSARESQAAAYLGGGTSARLLRMPVGMDGGMRLEWYDFRLRAPFTGLDSERDDLTSSLREWSLYPTAGLWAQPAGPLKLRLQYARTAVRPEFREVAPYQFVDFMTGRTVEGNPDLQKTRVVHYDARADLFLPFGQSLSASLFYKDFTDPVETIIDNNKKESFQNARSAYVRGVEFEAAMNPRHLLEGMGLSAPWLDGLRLTGNFALMESLVRIRRDTVSNQENTNFQRPMVGQAPYLINASVSHEAEGSRFGILNVVLFNMAGERIRFTGIQGVPDFMEKPFASLESLHRVAWNEKRDELGVRVKNWLLQSKELRVKEYHDKLAYNTVTPAEHQEVFGNVPRYQTFERFRESLWVEVTYSRRL